MPTVFVPKEAPAKEALAKRGRCSFELWDTDTKKMGKCQLPAVAFVRTNPKTFLCEEHFEWYVAHQQPETAVLTESYAKRVKLK